MSTKLFSTLKLRDIELKNRIVVSPMCMYSSDNGFANEWHFVHLGSYAVGGAALVFTEAAAVEARGRISPDDLGIYEEAHIEELSRITSFIRKQGSVPGIQLAHAGRKASMASSWKGGKLVDPGEGGWIPVGPSPVAFAEGYGTPEELDLEAIGDVVKAFGTAAERALRAGFEVIELHAAHGYLLHEFLSPLSNLRTDSYGGSFQNRIRLTIEVAEELRRHWPEHLPLFVRISSTDWREGGWTIDDSVELARKLKPLGADLIDCSSGGNVPRAAIPVGQGYQTPFAERIRREAEIPTGAVGMITSPAQAEHILQTGQADVVLLAREFLRDPYWPRRAAADLGAKIDAPVQYARGW
jgi:2,4-dienoyl-CoA reductase-like NADH-dependent reductase (Old Yellow Enzyme family)